MTFCMTMILIGISLGVIYGLNKSKSEIAIKDYKSRTILSIAISLVIMGINASLAYVVRWMSYKEHNETQTTHNLSISLKLTLARFVNTSIIPIIVNIDIKKWFVSGGLVSDIFYIVILINVLDPLL